MLWFFLLRHAIDFDIIIFIESVSQERQVLPQSSEIDNAERNGKFVDRIFIFLRKFFLLCVIRNSD